MNKSVYCISYDLRSPGRNYDDLITAIKSFGLWWHQTESVWFIVSDKDVVSIRDFLMNYIDRNDKLFVIEVNKPWAGTGFTNKEYEWLKDNLN